MYKPVDVLEGSTDGVASVCWPATGEFPDLYATGLGLVGSGIPYGT